jgi:glycosyl transferase family 25
MSLETFGPGIVINLPDRKDRREETELEFARIGFKNFSFFQASRPLDRGAFASIGERGAYESHLAVLRGAIGRPCALVMEDDVQFSDDIASLPGLVAAMPDSWDVMYLGHAQIAEIAKDIRGRGLVRVGSEYEFICLHCYAVNGKAIAKLVDAFDDFLTRPSGDPAGGPMPIDGALNVARRTLGLETYVINPPIANQRASRTDIGRLKWFDKIEALRRPVHRARRLKNKLKRIWPRG